MWSADLRMMQKTLGISATSLTNPEQSSGWEIKVGDPKAWIKAAWLT